MNKNRCLLTVVLALLVPLTLSAQWEPEVRLTNDASESRTSFNNAWCVASYDTVVHVVWHDNRDGNTEIYYKRSWDNGTTWEADARLTNDASWSERPTVAVRDSIVHVAWYDGRLGPPRVFYKNSTDNGTTWSTDVCLDPTVGVAYHPSMAVIDSIVHVVWTDMSAGPQIYYARSLDNGATWGDATLITPAAPAAGKNLASVAVSDSIVHVTWTDTRVGPQIYYTRSVDNGTTWETDRNITPVPSQFASVAVVDSIVHVVYADFRNGTEVPTIYYVRSWTDGTTWETETRIADAFASWYPSVATCDANVHAVWPDNRNGDTSEIYYDRSFDNGTGWGADVRLTDNPSESREPSVAVSGSCIHVVWHDSRDGNWEIYYKRDSTGNVGVSQQEEIVVPRRRSFTVPLFFSDRITIGFDRASDGPLKIALFDILGAAVLSVENASVPSSLILDDQVIQRLAPGVYFLRVALDNRTETQKVLKYK